MFSALPYFRLVIVLLLTSFTSFAQQYDESGYYLIPGENPHKKISENLFIKLLVDKTTCFVGEPVVATYKLFSRLQSTSDIVKNPGFYGFSVHDMINLDDKVLTTEYINGKNFDVHTIRKVQLYPLHPGRFTIDEMRIENKVEFSKSVISKKTEQEITEGVLDNADETAASPDLEIYKTSLHTEPVVISVKPLPEKSKPESFSGAAGKFNLRAKLSKTELAKNEEGFLEIIVEGDGNFTQIIAPQIAWPREMEGFSPSVTDMLDKHKSPLNGARIFRYPFISSTPGKWFIPAVNFSFFNLKRQQYETIGTKGFEITIQNRDYIKIDPIIISQSNSIEATNRKASRIAFGIIAGLICIAVAYWFFWGNKNTKRDDLKPGAERFITAEEYFQPLLNDNAGAEPFFKNLYELTWKYLSEKYKLSGTSMNKAHLQEAILQEGNSNVLLDELFDLLKRLETIMYTTLKEDESKVAFTNKIVDVLNRLNK